MILRTISLSTFKATFLPTPQETRMFRCKPAEICTDEMYLDWLRRSCGEVAGYLDLNLTGGPDAVYEAKVDGIWHHDRNSWWLKRLPVRPLLDVKSLHRYLGDFKLHELPVHWSQESNHVGGNIQILPNPGGATVSGIRSNIMYPIAARHGYTPNEFHVKYTSGFVYAMSGELVATGASNTVTIASDESAETVLNGWAFSKLGLRNPVWVLFNDEVHQVDWCTGQTAKLRTYVKDDYVGEALIMAYPDSIRSAIMSLAAIYLIEHLASRNAGIQAGNLSIDALAQGRSFAIGKGYGIFSPLIARNQENFQRALNDAWDAWGPIHGMAV